MGRVGSIVIPCAALVAAALFEVGGDAIIRHGLRGRAWATVGAGCLMLAAYGLAVNLVPWDFSRLLGTYVAVFALAAVLLGKFWFGEAVPPSTWLGLALVVAGGLVIQFGGR